MKNYANIFGKIQLFVEKHDAEGRDFGGFFVEFHHIDTSVTCLKFLAR
jgi:hypothetical protein